MSDRIYTLEVSLRIPVNTFPDTWDTLASILNKQLMMRFRCEKLQSVYYFFFLLFILDKYFTSHSFVCRVISWPSIDLPVVFRWCWQSLPVVLVQQQQEVKVSSAVPGSLQHTLEERVAMYKTALQNAKTAGETSKTRRYDRGLKVSKTFAWPHCGLFSIIDKIWNILWNGITWSTNLFVPELHQ